MIDYEITVNVEGLTREEKMRVQGAFFKLGFAWWSGDRFSQLDKDCYTNRMVTGEVMQAIMWADASIKPTHTVDELLELAGMKQKQSMTLFDLERALAGEPVVTRDGQEVTQLTLFQTSSKYALAGVVGGDIIRFTKEGTYYHEADSHELDLFMKVKTHTVNGFEVPAPITDPDQLGDEKLYFLPAVFANKWFSTSSWDGDEYDFMRLNRNIVFWNEEDAIANAKAMAGVNPYGE